MKHAILFLLLSFAVQFCFAQNSDGPQEVTPALKQKLLAEINKQAEVFKKSLSQKNMSKYEIEYAVDTFKLERLCAREIDYNYSTAGMNEAMNEMTDGYDKLMNKYYNLLMGLLKGDDKKTLVTAQRAWLAFRDAETKLMGTVTRPEYTGGGTMYSNIRTSAYSVLVCERTQKIFNYYTLVVSGGY